MNFDLDQISSFLDLEKICVIERITILCLPKKPGLEFASKLLLVEKQIKQQLGSNIELKIMEEGEVVNDPIIQLSLPYNNNGTY